MSIQPTRILLAGPAATALTAMLNASHGNRFEVATVPSAVEALDYLAKQEVEVALVDLSLPDALEWVRAAAPRVPVVALVASEDEGRQAIEAGVQDYLVTSELDQKLLQRALRYAIDNHRLKLELTLLDPLTGLYNRRGFIAVAEYYLKLARRLQHSLVLCYLDIDNLSAINRDHGFAEGNRALQRVSGMLRSNFRESDVLARLGDDEFAFFALGASDRNADAMATRLTEALRPSDTAELHPPISLSAAVVWFDPESAPPLDELMKRAETGLREQLQKKGLA